MMKKMLGDDNNKDLTIDVDGMEELDHSDIDPKTAPSKEQKRNENTPAQGHQSSRAGGSSKRVATWARLFQDEENMCQIENSGIEDYSCVKLLREIEALE
jgi:hypothetical protein